MSNKFKLRGLKWLTVLLPPFLVWIYETVRHSIILDEIDTWWGNLLAAGVVLTCSFIFAQIVFGLINRMQIRLTSQNRKLQELNRRVKELAVVEERARLSREIHDGVAQVLAYLMLKIDTVETLLQTGRLTDAEKELEQARKACNDAYGDVREVISGLRPEFFDNRNFVTILRDMLDNFSDNTKVETALELNLKTPELNNLISPAATIQLTRVIQEALSNIRKHAGATRVIAKISMGQASVADSGGPLDPKRPLTITIKDNGCGFDTQTPEKQRGHYGHKIMQERIESLGGEIELSSTLNKGTTLQIHLPIAENEIMVTTEQQAGV